MKLQNNAQLIIVANHIVQAFRKNSETIKCNFIINEETGNITLTVIHGDVKLTVKIEDEIDFVGLYSTIDNGEVNATFNLHYTAQSNIELQAIAITLANQLAFFTVI